MVGEHGSILQIKFKGNVSVKKTWDRKSKACGREEQQKKSWDPKSLSDLQVKMSCYLRVCFQEQISAFFFFPVKNSDCLPYLLSLISLKLKGKNKTDWVVLFSYSLSPAVKNLTQNMVWFISYSQDGKNSSR